MQRDGVALWVLLFLALVTTAIEIYQMRSPDAANARVYQPANLRASIR